MVKVGLECLAVPLTARQMMRCFSRSAKLAEIM